MKSASGKSNTSNLPVLLLALGGSVVGLCWWSLALIPETPPAAVIANLDPVAAAPLAAGGQAEQGLAAGSMRSAQQRLPTEAAALPPTSDAPPPGSERGLRRKYLSLEAAEPGYLAAHTQEWLDAQRPSAEKVAWLLALHEHDAAAATAWLEFACSLDDPASAHGESVAAFALGFLERHSARDSASRAALGRVACDSALVDVALRRRAAATFASQADALELQTFAQAMLREPDESLRAGVVVALEARTDAESRLAVDRMLAWLRPASAEFLARRTDGTP